MRRTLLASLALMLLLATASAAHATLLYPNLKTLPPRNLRFDYTDVSVNSSGVLHHVLRFSNTAYNVGEGPLEIRATIDMSHSPPSGPAYQRVYDSGGGFTDIPLTGSTLYYHAVHKHYHFDNWGGYQLWTKAAYDNWVMTGIGQPDLVGTKTTSCVEDEEFVSPIAAAVWPARYPASSCLPNAQHVIAEGLSPGWGDTYDYYRFEQWIDLGSSSLADGTYVLRSVADPANIVYESPGKADASRESQGDNAATTTFTVSGGRILDTAAPTGTVTIDHVDATTGSPDVSLAVLGRDDVSGVDQFRVSNDGSNWATYNNSSYDSVPQTIAWNLANSAYGGNAASGTKTVYVMFHDAAGHWGPVTTDSIGYRAPPPPPPPGGTPTLTAPTGLSATALSSSQIHLTWSNTSSGEGNEVLERSTSSAFASVTSFTLPAGTQSYSDVGLRPGRTYWYRVKAVAGASSSPYSSALPATTLAPTTYPDAVLQDHPVSYWRLDETGGTVAGDTTVANPGTFAGGVRLGAPGLIPSDPANTAVGFDGASADVRIGEAGSLDLSSAMSLEAWIQPTSLPAPGSFASILTKPESYSLQLNGPLLEFTVIELGSRFRLQAPAGTIVPGGRYHVVGTYDGSTASLYVNGALVASRALSGVADQTLNGLHIGSWNGSQEFFAGTIDDAAVYAKALSATQVAAHHAAAFPLLDAPSDLSAAAASATQVDLGWTDNAFGYSGQVLQRSADAGFSSPTSIPLPVGVESFSDTGLTPGTTYWYRVAAVTATDASGWSNAATARTSSLPTGPGASAARLVLTARLSASRARLRRGRTGLKLFLRSSAAARPRLVLVRLTRGIRRGRRCVAPRGHGRRCTRARAVGSRTVRIHAGRTTLTVPVRYGRGKLGPGRWQLDIFAPHAAPIRLTFIVVR